MLFVQTKNKEGFVYETADVFGTIRITSKSELSKETLDDIVLGILQAKAPVGTINEHISFTFQRAQLWLEDELPTRYQLLTNFVTDVWRSLKKRLSNYKRSMTTWIN